MQRAVLSATEWHRGGGEARDQSPVGAMSPLLRAQVPAKAGVLPADLGKRPARPGLVHASCRLRSWTLPDCKSHLSSQL